MGRNATRNQALTGRALPHAGVLLALFVLAVAATWPLFPNMGGYVIDRNNPLYSVWLMAWQAHALATDPTGIFNTNIMYPIKGTLAFDELAFTEAVLAAPLYWASGNPVLSHNALLFSTFILSGYGTWLLVRELTGSAWAAFVGGTAFAFSFYMLNHLPHMTLINAQWIPFMLWAGYKFLWTGAWRWGLAMAGFFVLQALSGHYLAFYTALLLGLYFAYYFLVQRGLFTWRFIGKTAASLGLAAVFILPVALPYALIQGSQGFKRNLFEVERFSNTLFSFLAVFRGSPAYQKLLAPFADPGPWAVDRSAFPGFATLIMGIAAVPLAMRYARRISSGEQVRPAPQRGPLPLSRHAVFFGAVALLSAFLSLGPSLQVTYAPSVYDPQAIRPLMPLPYLLLHDWVPGFQTMRVVSRIGVLTSLSLAVLVGIGAYFVLWWFEQRISNRRVERWAIPALAVMLSLLPVAESWSAPIGMEAVGTREAVPPVYRWLASQPPTVILEYPMTNYRRGEASVVMANLYQYYSTYHWQKMINASTAIRPFAYSALVRETEDCFPCPRSLDALWAMDVKYVVAHLENLSGPQRTDFLWRSTNPAGKVVDHFTLVAEFGDDRVYSLKPREIGKLTELIAPGEAVLLGDPGNDPTLGKGELVYGGYMAALGNMLRDRPQFGDARLSFGQPISPLDQANRPDNAILWAGQDPATAGFRPEDRVWSNEYVVLYRRRGGIASEGIRP